MEKLRTKSARDAGVLCAVVVLVLAVASCNRAQRVPVDSSAMRSVGYDDAAEILEIEFHNGSVYQYFGVPEQVYEGLMAADSHGRYFHSNIRNAGYQYERIH